ncbi:hypothetical protein GDO81_015218 [Engystomops pustulosus]|uniref:Acyl-coenzyme A thioesterase 1 n=1 Tax=Engystomops pustulosus TaxID=76066 RepID=A0AAV7AHN1_ENGPU|nr:hypothetical protein GDO81_015218 [Engystomops pustulosus]
MMLSLLPRTLPHVPRSSRAMSGVRLQVVPGRCLYDAPLRLQVCGLSPGQDVSLHTALSDEGGQLFSSVGRYRADSSGELDVSRSPALEGGSYTDPYQLRLLSFPAPTIHHPPGFPLSLLAQDRASMRKGLTRWPVRDWRVREALPAARSDSFVIAPGVWISYQGLSETGPGPFPGVIEVQGTGGGLLEYKASLLANRGFATLALAYYNYEDLPKDMKEFRLEYFEEAVNYMLKHPQVMGPGIGLLGHSKGGDLVLSMASFLKGIAATAVVNGSVANVAATLRYKDITLPPIGIDAKKLKHPQPGVGDISDVLLNPLEEANRKSLIPVGRADCKLLFIVAGDDKNWKSDFYAQTACQLLAEAGKEKPEVVLYPKAGHYIEPPNFPLCKMSMHKLVGMPVVWGGEPKAHAMAQVDSWKRIQDFFNKHLKKKSQL